MIENPSIHSAPCDSIVYADGGPYTVIYTQRMDRDKLFDYQSDSSFQLQRDPLIKLRLSYSLYTAILELDGQIAKLPTVFFLYV